MPLDFFAMTVRAGGTELGLSLVMAILAAVVAHAKGRSAVLWFFVGLITSCFGFLILLFLSDLREEAESASARESRAHRTEERLRQEVRKQEEFRRRIAGRVEAHDVALGIDTRGIRGPLAVAGGLPVSGERPEWFYEDAGHAAGPLARHAIQTLLNAGAIGPDTLLWRPGLHAWTPCRDLPDILC